MLGVTVCSRSSASLPVGVLAIDGRAGTVPIRVEIAETEHAKELGLMHRRHLASDRGMVFLFDRPTASGFWMKDTLIPLSIAFWDAARRIVSMIRMAPCRSSPCPIYRPRHAYVGALEVNRGFFSRHGIVRGDAVALTRASR